jgi:hypothetical protein
MKEHRRQVLLVMLLGILPAAPAHAQLVYPSCAPVYAQPLIYYPAVPAWYAAPARSAPAQPAMPPMPAPAPAKADRPAPPPAEPSLPGKKLTSEPAAPAPDQRAPEVTEARFQGTAIPEAAAQARCRVGFWNLTGRDVVLTVGGQRQPLARDRALTVELPLSFQWRVDEAAARTERISPGRIAHEIIIRD